MLRVVAVTAVLSSALTLAGMRFAGAAATAKIQLENTRVCVTELTYSPGESRARYTRAADQVIVFLDDCRYERTDSATGAKQIREHRSGDVIWHQRGEDAPVLKNVGIKPYRTLTIELK